MNTRPLLGVRRLAHNTSHNHVCIIVTIMYSTSLILVLMGFLCCVLESRVSSSILAITYLQLCAEVDRPGSNLAR